MHWCCLSFQGCIVGTGNELGSPVAVADASSCMFGLVLLNDWSCRDIMRWEMAPLGPFNGKGWVSRSNSTVFLPSDCLGWWMTLRPCCMFFVCWFLVGQLATWCFLILYHRLCMKCLEAITPVKWLFLCNSFEQLCAAEQSCAKQSLLCTSLVIQCC